MSNRPNIVYLLVDQLRASSLPIHGETQIETPNIDRLAREGTVFTNCISACPVCTPARSMLLTGRHPQTTGHVVNFMRTRHDEIGIGDAFRRTGYRTGWVGKWHLHTGSFPEINGKDFVPEGRDRLGFEYWRGYNFHMDYFNGWINKDDWRCERWEGYETDALNRYAFEFMDQVGDDPFLLFISPHQPHATPGQYAEEHHYARVPETLTLPDNVPESMREESLRMYRHYLAMTIACDDMLGALMDYLERTGRRDNTLLIFTSDHGTQGGAHGINPWAKLEPYEESLRVPLIMRLPGMFENGRRSDVLISPVDFFPSLCGLCGIHVPRTVEGIDLSAAWQGTADAPERDAVFTMNFTATYDFLLDGSEWRGVRARQYTYARWRNRRTEMYDLRQDPLQMNNLADAPEMAHVRRQLEDRLARFMAERNDDMPACTSYANWFDSYRRVVRNAYGPLGDPEDAPDWSLLY